MSDSIRNSISLFVCGDIINQFATRQFIDGSIVRHIQSCDYAIGNLEGVVAMDGCPAMKMQQTEETVPLLKDAGFDMLLLANNHIADYGEDGLKRTISTIEKNMLSHVGASFPEKEIYTSKDIRIGGKKFSLINLCEAQSGYFGNESQSYGYAWIGHYRVEQLIRDARSRCDYLIIFVHAGLEHYQLPLRQFRSLYRHYCDLGADCVIGSHPHIAQGVERYNDSLIAYSLGNFYFPRHKKADRFSDVENNAFSLKLTFGKGAPQYDVIYHGIENGTVVETSAHPTTDVEKLNNHLSEDKYLIGLKTQNIDAYNKVVSSLYNIAFNGARPNARFIYKLKFTLKYLFSRDSGIEEKKKMKLLHHLNANETYRYVIEDVTSNSSN